VQAFYKILFPVLFLSMIITGRCTKDQQKNIPDEPADTNSVHLSDSVPDICVPYISENDVTYIQPFGVLLDFGGGDMRPHAAIDFGCGDSVEFRAGATGVLGSIWLEYPHSYQFNIVINDRLIVHYCLEPVNISSLSDEEKLDAIYFSPGDSVKKGQIICKMVGGGGHLDWGLIIDDERVCPACYLIDADYEQLNNLFKALPDSYEGYENLCPDNGYHTNPRP
jgi:hypothetical protein